MEFDLQDTDVDTIGQGGTYEAPSPGKYHMLVQSVDPKDGTDEAMEVTYEILTGTVADQEGKTIRCWFYKKGKTAESTRSLRERILAFAIATGLTSREKLAELKAAGQRPRINLEAAEGRTCMVELKQGKKQDGTPRVECSWTPFSVSDEAVADWPKHSQYLQPAPEGAGAPFEDAFAGAGF